MLTKVNHELNYKLGFSTMFGQSILRKMSDEHPELRSNKLMFAQRFWSDLEERMKSELKKKLSNANASNHNN